MSVFGSVRAAALLATAAAAPVPIVDAPAIRAGDTWFFNDTHERGTNAFQAVPVEMRVERVDADDMMIGIKTPGSPADYQDRLIGRDWSPMQLVDGVETRTGRPLSFPLSPNKSWSADYDNKHRYGRQVSARFHTDYRVIGWEEVTTPAGTFQAVRIEGRARVDAKLEPIAGVAGGVVADPQGVTSVHRIARDGPADVHHMIISTFDYVPAVKAVVKTVEEQFDADGVRTSRDTRELVRFTPAA